jgi:hypothetical protein
MEDNVVWLINNQIQANKILEWYKKSKLSIVTSANDLTDTITLANSIQSDFNQISIDCLYSNFTFEQLAQYNEQLNPGVTIELWTIDNIDDFKSYLPYVSGITSNKISVKDL